MCQSQTPISACRDFLLSDAYGSSVRIAFRDMWPHRRPQCHYAKAHEQPLPIRTLTLIRTGGCITRHQIAFNVGTEVKQPEATWRTTDFDRAPETCAPSISLSIDASEATLSWTEWNCASPIAKESRHRANPPSAWRISHGRLIEPGYSIDAVHVCLQLRLA